MAFSERNLLHLALLSSASSLLVFGLFATTGVDTPASPGCTERFIDFHVLWSAGRLALAGTPLGAFDQATLLATYDACQETLWLPWLHPAPVMTLMAGFAMLPFLPAWLAFNAVSLGAMALALRAFHPPSSATFWAIFLAPAVLPSLLAGQTAILWMAGLLGMLAGLRFERPWLAGICIGLLTLKPTLGLMIPFALLAIWNLRVIGIAILTTLVVHGAASLLHGVAYWPTWLQASEAQIGATIAGLGEHNNLASLAALLAHLGIPPQLAASLNLGVAVLLAATVFIVWRRFGTQSNISAATLCVAIPLSSAYLWHYDAAFLCLAAMFLRPTFEHRPTGATPILLIAMWFGPGLSIWNNLTLNAGWLEPVWTMPPLMLLALGLCLARAIKTPYARQA